MDYTALKNEIQNDPLNLGYVAFVALGNDSGVAALLNATTGPGAGAVSLSSVTINEFLLSVAPAYLRLPTLSDALQKKWDRILSVLTGVTAVNLTDLRIQALLQEAVTDGVLLQAELNNIFYKVGSRAEVVLGTGVVVSHTDVAIALRNT